MAELIVYGIILGSIISLGAIGITLLYGILRFGNFAHGDMMTLGGYVAYLFAATLFPKIGIAGGKVGPFSFGYGMFLAIALSVVAVAALAVLVDRLVYGRLRRRGSALVLMAMASLGIAIAIQSTVFLGWGPQPRFYVSGVQLAWMLPMGIKLRPDQLFVFLVAIALAIGTHVFLKYSRMGKAMRATADNMDLARVTGIDTERVVAWTWAIGAGLAAIAGILMGLEAQLQPTMGWSFLIPLFAATILGGIGNPYGAFLGAMIVGICQQVSTAWLLPAYKPAVAFVIMIVVLLVRPRGLLGRRA